MRLAKKKILFILSLFVSDSLVLAASVYFSVWLRFYIFADFFQYKTISDIFALKYILLIKFLIPLLLLLTSFSNGYKSFFVSPIDEFVRVAKIATSFILLCIVLSFLIKVDYSRTVFILVWLNLIVFMFLSRQLFKFIAGFILRVSNKRNNMIMIGKNVRKYSDIFKNNPENKVFFYPLELNSKDMEKIKSLILKKQIKQIILVNHVLSDYDILSFYDWAEYNGIVFKILPNEISICRGEIKVDSTLSVPVFQFISNSLTGVDYFLKRTFDIFISLILLVILLPFLIILAILIKLESKGTIFYTQIRQGYRGKQFKFYKLRSMFEDADIRLKNIKISNNVKNTVFFKMKNDPRITKIGKYIRRYSIDELPQLINVLKGDMSLVGPRPMLVHEIELLKKNNISGFKKSFRVIPGITGLWQISGRSLLSDEKRIELDIFYVEHWSFGLDIKILFKTVWIILFPKGAY